MGNTNTGMAGESMKEAQKVLIMFYLGLSEISSGSLIFIAGIVASGLGFGFDIAAEISSLGIFITFCSAFVITSGALGVHLRSEKTKVMFTANLVVPILGSLAMASSLVLSALGIAFAVLDDDANALAVAYALYPCLALSLGAMVVCMVHAVFAHAAIVIEEEIVASAAMGCGGGGCCGDTEEEERLLIAR